MPPKFTRRKLLAGISLAPVAALLLSIGQDRLSSTLRSRVIWRTDGIDQVTGRTTITELVAGDLKPGEVIRVVWKEPWIGEGWHAP